VTIPRVLVIAGSDSGGGAGIQADIKTITMLGGHAMTAITAITAQSTLGISDVMAVPTAMVMAQIEAVAGDIGVDVVKIGMIGSATTAQAVADWLGQLRRVSVVFDPVMVATSGDPLADDETVAAFEALLSRATLITPNADELAAMTGLTLGSEADIAAAARQLFDAYGCAVLATGQQLSGGEIRYADGQRVQTKGRLFDMLFGAGPGGTQELCWDDVRIDTVHDHGTGCTLASAIAVGLANGLDLAGAIGRARAYVRAALSTAPALGGGRGPMGHALGDVPFVRIG
jgi:hydroxymethylpyrimidine/phosphomethylpyrimidine kinase